jgi:hypothetical protein
LVTRSRREAISRLLCKCANRRATRITRRLIVSTSASRSR